MHANTNLTQIQLYPIQTHEKCAKSNYVSASYQTLSPILD